MDSKETERHEECLHADRGRCGDREACSVSPCRQGTLWGQRGMQCVSMRGQLTFSGNQWGGVVGVGRVVFVSLLFPVWPCRGDAAHRDNKVPTAPIHSPLNTLRTAPYTASAGLTRHTRHSRHSLPRAKHRGEERRGEKRRGEGEYFKIFFHILLQGQR